MKSTSHLYVRFRSIKYISSQLAEIRPGKILIYNLNITLKHEYLLAEILENGTFRFLEVLTVKNWNCPNKIRMNGRYVMMVSESDQI